MANAVWIDAAANRWLTRMLHQSGETGANTLVEVSNSMHVRGNITWWGVGTYPGPWRGLERLRFTQLKKRGRSHRL